MFRKQFTTHTATITVVNEGSSLLMLKNEIQYSKVFLNIKVSPEKWRTEM